MAVISVERQGHTASIGGFIANVHKLASQIEDSSMHVACLNDRKDIRDVIGRVKIAVILLKLCTQDEVIVWTAATSKQKITDQHKGCENEYLSSQTSFPTP